MTDKFDEHKVRLCLDSHFDWYFTRQQHVSVILILAITSIFITLSLIIKIRWVNNKNTLFKLFVKKILSFKNNYQPKISQKSQTDQISKSLGNKNDKNFMEKQSQFINKVSFLDPVLTEDVKNLDFGRYLEQNILDSILRSSEQARRFLKVTKWLQYLSLYQPILILGVSFFSRNPIVWFESLEADNGNQIGEELENRNDNDSEIKDYVGISMMGVSLLIFFVLNCSDCLIGFVQTFSDKQEKEKASKSMITEQTPETVLSSKKVSLKIVTETKMSEVQLVSQKLIKNRKNTISFKLINSLKILHLMYLIPLFILIALLLTTELQF